MSYQILVIEEPYNYYENSSITRSYMSDIFKNQLRGYKQYYPNGVCPVSEYDFFTNHIAIIDSLSQEVVCSYKITKNSTCKKYKKEFPLFLTLGESYPKHTSEVKKWLLSNPNAGYNHSWTIKPELSKRDKKKLVDITFAVLAKFYEEHKVDNIIDISIMPFKIHLIKQWMGNTYLSNLTPFKVEQYGDLQGCIMVNEGLKFSDDFKESISKYTYLWDSRITINKSSYENEVMVSTAA